jgi:hypothetical protein
LLPLPRRERRDLVLPVADDLGQSMCQGRATSNISRVAISISFGE